MALNSLVVYPAFLYLKVALDDFEVELSFAVEEIPSHQRVFASLLFFIMAEDLAFHLAHRLFHIRILYTWFHKQHHEFKYSIGLATEYLNPIDYMVGGMLPAGLGAMILGRHLHVSTLFMWSIMRSLEGADGHSGYEFSWSPFRLIPFSTGADYHSYHHTYNIGNYSSMSTIWDTLFNTNQAYFKYEERLQQVSAEQAAKEEDLKAGEFEKLGTLLCPKKEG